MSYSTGGVYVQRARFATAFVRGHGFRLEFQPVQGYSNVSGEPTRIAVQEFHGRTFELIRNRGWRPADEPLAKELGAMVGVTMGVSFEVPSLLLPELRERISLVPECAYRGEGRSAEGDDDYNFECRYGELDFKRFVIRKSDLVLTRVEQYEDLSRSEKYHGDMKDHASNPLPLPGSLANWRRITFHAELNGPVDLSEVELPSELGDTESSVTTRSDPERAEPAAVPRR